MNEFRAYDIRGLSPKNINKEFAYDLAKAVGTVLKPINLVVGRDCRTTSEDLAKSVIEGLRSLGISVISIGQVSTPQFYFAINNSYADGGIMITASHNPKDQNGFKICEAKAVPVFKDNKLEEIQKVFEEKSFDEAVNTKGKLLEKNTFEEYKKSFLKFQKTLSKKYRVLVDTGNGMGIKEWEVLKYLFGENLNGDILFEEINGEFPFHEPDPTNTNNTTVIRTRLEDQKRKYDFGIAFDGDADRIIFFTSNGEMISPDLITGLIGGSIALKNELIGYEVRTSNAVKEYLEEKGIQSKKYPAGSAYMKTLGARDNAIMLGEKSGHYMYKTLNYSDSPLLTLIYLFNILEHAKQPLSELIKPLEKYICEKEENFQVDNPEEILEEIKEAFKEFRIEEIDGVSVIDENEEFSFNIRKSNTQDLLRLNIQGINQEIIDVVKEKLNLIINKK